MSFLDKIKKKISEDDGKLTVPQISDKSDELPESEAELARLAVDIYESRTEFVLYAPIPGVDIEKLDIFVEGESDVVTVQGKKISPVGERPDVKSLKAHHREADWGDFYRQIVLPQEIDVSKIEATAKKGVLILRLPLLRLPDEGKKSIKVSKDSKI